LAHEIVEKNDGSENLGLVGIKRRGVPLAERLAKLIAGIEKRPGGYRRAGHQPLSRRPDDDRRALRWCRARSASM